MHQLSECKFPDSKSQIYFCRANSESHRQACCCWTARCLEVWPGLGGLETFIRKDLGVLTDGGAVIHHSIPRVSHLHPPPPPANSQSSALQTKHRAQPSQNYHLYKQIFLALPRSTKLAINWLRWNWQSDLYQYIIVSHLILFKLTKQMQRVQPILIPEVNWRRFNG